MIAVDNQISLRIVDRLKQHFNVVLWAGTMSDEEWVDEAYARGATVFISPDLDIPNLIDRLYPDEGIRWIDVPQGLAREKQFDYLMKELRKVA